MSFEERKHLLRLIGQPYEPVVFDAPLEALVPRLAGAVDLLARTGTTDRRTLESLIGDAKPSLRLSEVYKRFRANTRDRQVGLSHRESQKKRNPETLAIRYLKEVLGNANLFYLRRDARDLGVRVRVPGDRGVRTKKS